MKHPQAGLYWLVWWLQHLPERAVARTSAPAGVYDSSAAASLQNSTEKAKKERGAPQNQSTVSSHGKKAAAQARHDMPAL